MNTLNYEIEINAPVEKVWDTMLGLETYKEWTKPFNPAGSSFEGSWEQDSKILFLGPDPETGKMGGMVSRIKENRNHEYISIEHLGEVSDGVEDTTSEKVKAWKGALENYTFTPTDSGTKVSVELTQIPDEFKGYMDDTWPKGLEKLKEMCEK